MTKKLKKVRPEDSNKEMLWQMALEGIVYIDYSKKAVNQEEVIQNVRAYVARIESLVDRHFRKSIKAIWDDILIDEKLFSLLMPTNRASFNDFNKYGVLRIICVLHNNGVYDYCNDMDAFSLLESKDKNNKFRRFLGAGIDDDNQRLEVRHIVDKYKV